MAPLEPVDNANTDVLGCKNLLIIGYHCICSYLKYCPVDGYLERLDRFDKFTVRVNLKQLDAGLSDEHDLVRVGPVEAQ